MPYFTPASLDPSVTSWFYETSRMLCMLLSRSKFGNFLPNNAPSIKRAKRPFFISPSLNLLLAQNKRKRCDLKRFRIRSLKRDECNMASSQQLIQHHLTEACSCHCPSLVQSVPIVTVFYLSQASGAASLCRFKTRYRETIYLCNSFSLRFLIARIYC